MWVCVIAGQTSMGLDGGEQRGMKRTDFGRNTVACRGETYKRQQKTQQHNQKNTTTRPETQQKHGSKTKTQQKKNKCTSI